MSADDISEHTRSCKFICNISAHQLGIYVSLNCIKQKNAVIIEPSGTKKNLITEMWYMRLTVMIEALCTSIYFLCVVDFFLYKSSAQFTLECWNILTSSNFHIICTIRSQTVHPYGIYLYSYACICLFISLQ